MPSSGGKAPGGKLGGNILGGMGMFRGLLTMPGGGIIGRWGGICPPPPMANGCMWWSRPGGGGRWRICVGCGRLSPSGLRNCSSRNPGGPCCIRIWCWEALRSRWNSASRSGMVGMFVCFGGCCIRARSCSVRGGSGALRALCMRRIRNSELLFAAAEFCSIRPLF